jgi:ectoine hydroxylase-related dioxygenase (phytanoyl-CoA dioxygenase family)
VISSIPTYPLSDEQLALLPTEEDVAFYEEHGWYISKKIIPDDVIDGAIAASERFYRGEIDTPLPTSTGYSNWRPGDDSSLRNNEFVALQNRVLHELSVLPILGAIAARLARTPSVRRFEDQLVYKAPQATAGKGVVGWHTDHAYSSNCTSDKLLAAWIPFHDSVGDRAPLVVIDGSHRWKGTDHLRDFNQQDLKKTEEQFATDGRKIVEVPMVMPKGHASFHHGWVIHGSYRNHHQEPRLALAVHFQDEENRYQPFWNDQGRQIHHYLDSVCRKQPDGRPDYSDPAVFPLVWAEPR